jgi:hypothetical protein
VGPFAATAVVANVQMFAMASASLQPVLALTWIVMPLAALVVLAAVTPDVTRVKIVQAAQVIVRLFAIIMLIALTVIL